MSDTWREGEKAVWMDWELPPGERTPWVDWDADPWYITPDPSTQRKNRTRRCTARLRWWSKTNPYGQCRGDTTPGRAYCSTHLRKRELMERKHGARAQARIAMLDLLPTAVEAHKQILEDPDSDPKTRLKAAEMLYDRTGITKAGTDDHTEIKRLIALRIAEIREASQVSRAATDIIDGEIIEPAELEAPDEWDLL